MFSSTKTCLYEETNGSYSSTVMGILIVILGIAVGLSVLGVMVNAENGPQNDDFELPFIPKRNSLKDIISDQASEEVCDVPVPECGCLGPFDTEPGTLEVIDENLPTDPLPLCIDNEYLDDFYVVVESIGGYSPKWASLCLNQMKSGGCCDYNINVDWTETAVPGCPCAVDYRFTFSLPDDEKICLDSNHLPVGFDQSKTLDKEVYLYYHMCWEGCCQESQEFPVILAHKAMSQKPQLPIFNIASLRITVGMTV